MPMRSHRGRREFGRAARASAAPRSVQRTGHAHNEKERAPRRAKTIAGKLILLRSGDGIVRVEGGKDEVFIPRWAVGSALPEDTVQVQLLSGVPAPRSRSRAGAPAERGCSGRVMSVLKRTRRDIVGTLRSDHGRLFLVPIDSTYRKDFRVTKTKGGKADDRVVARLVGWENRSADPMVEVLEVIGHADSPSSDTVSLLRHYGLPSAFPPEALRDAESVALLGGDAGARIDLTGELVFTIDPATARDFDDALSLRRDSEGNHVLGVHIADVAHFVKPGSEIDKEAARRGNSVYLPDTVIPMLPEQLSNLVCSLRPGEDRLAFSVFLTLDAERNVVRRGFEKTVIRSKHRFNYEEALSILEAPAARREAEPARTVRAIGAIAQQLRKKRFAEGALALDVPECEVVLDSEGGTAGLRLVHTDPSHQLIEECMVAANEAVAVELGNRGLAAIYRIHEPPSSDQVEEMTSVLAEMGYFPGNLRNRRVLSNFLLTVESSPLAYAARVAVLRCMMRAEYSCMARGHFGLAKKRYLHFTSPIRRYPDLAVHRQLAAALWGPEDQVSSKRQLSTIAEHCSRTEETAQLVEREVIEIKKHRFLAEQRKRDPDRAYDAVIAGAARRGLLVELPEFQMRGFVRMEAEQGHRAERRGKASDSRRPALASRFPLGSTVRVKVAAVDVERRQVDLTLA